jgi:hypothetical protein
MLEEYERIRHTLKSDAVRPTGIGFVLPGMLRPRSETQPAPAPTQAGPQPRQEHES